MVAEGKVNVGVDTARYIRLAPLCGREHGGLSIESNEGGVVPRRLWPVARGLAEGLENDEIAERSALAKHTVEDYVHQLTERLGESNRVRLAMRCKEMVEEGEFAETAT